MLYNRIVRFLKDTRCSSDILSKENNSFLLSLMILSSYVIIADNEIMATEMDFVDDFLADNFGIDKKNRYSLLLRALFAEAHRYSHEEWQSKLHATIDDIASYSSKEQLILIFKYLKKISKADGVIVNNETEVLEHIARMMHIEEDVDQDLNLLREK